MSLGRGLKRIIRKFNLVDTIGFHKYKLGDAGKEYWESRIKNARDDEEIAYCVAQLEKCKINKARKKEAIANDPKIRELREKREELLKKLKDVYLNEKLTIEQKTALQYKIKSAIEALDILISQRENEIISILHSQYKSAIGLFDESKVEEEHKIGNVGWGKIKSGAKQKQEKSYNENNSSAGNDKTKSENPLNSSNSSKTGNYSPMQNIGTIFDNGNKSSENSKDKKFEQKSPKEMSKEELDDLIESALDIEKEIVEMTETPGEKVKREREERIEAIKTAREEKEEELRKIEEKIESIKNTFNGPLKIIEDYEIAIQIDEHINECKAKARNISLEQKMVNGILGNTDKIIKDLKITGSRIKLINELSDAEKRKDNDAIEKNKKELAKLLNKDVGDIRDSAKEKAEALEMLEDTKGGILVKIDQDGKVIRLTDEDRAKLKISDFIKIVENIRDNKDEVLENLSTSQKGFEAEAIEAEKRKPTNIPTQKEYEDAKTATEPIVTAIDVWKEEKRKIEQEIEKLSLEQQQFEIQEPAPKEDTIDLTDLKKLIGGRMLTSPELDKALNAVLEALSINDRDPKTKGNEIGE